MSTTAVTTKGRPRGREPAKRVATRRASLEEDAVSCESRAVCTRCQVVHHCPSFDRGTSMTLPGVCDLLCAGVGVPRSVIRNVVHAYLSSYKGRFSWPTAWKQSSAAVGDGFAWRVNYDGGECDRQEVGKGSCGTILLDDCPRASAEPGMLGSSSRIL